MPNSCQISCRFMPFSFFFSCRHATFFVLSHVVMPLFEKKSCCHAKIHAASCHAKFMPLFFFMRHHVSPFHAIFFMRHRVMPFHAKIHAISCEAVFFHAISCHFMRARRNSCGFMSCLLMSCGFMPHAESCLMYSCHATFMPHVFSCHATFMPHVSSCHYHFFHADSCHFSKKIMFSCQTFNNFMRIHSISWKVHANSCDIFLKFMFVMPFLFGNSCSHAIISCFHAIFIRKFMFSCHYFMFSSHF